MCLTSRRIYSQEVFKPTLKKATTTTTKEPYRATIPSSLSTRVGVICLIVWLISHRPVHDLTAHSYQTQTSPPPRDREKAQKQKTAFPLGCDVRIREPVVAFIQRTILLSKVINHPLSFHTSH